MLVGEQVASRRVAIFRHIARLGQEVPAHQALHAHVDLSPGHFPGWDWKRCPARPNNRQVDQVRNDTGQHALDVTVISHLSWRWHRSDATAFAGYAKMMMMMMMNENNRM